MLVFVTHTHSHTDTLTTANSLPVKGFAAIVEASKAGLWEPEWDDLCLSSLVRVLMIAEQHARLLLVPEASSHPGWD